MRATGTRSFHWLVLALMIGPLVTLSNAGAPSAPAEERPSLVFVTQSDACDCVVNLCVAGEQAVLNFLGSADNQLRYQRVDLSEDAAAGKKYRAVTLPVVLLFDGAGGEIARFDSFFTEAQLAGVWQQYLAGREGKQ